ncbi:glycoside hydrolase superfamily [Globomyces pollinis-pini]|nr:glycoside hydrolase superfamily [Globomyces pollinis-pini]
MSLFVTREGSKLKWNNTNLVFASFNAPNLMMVEDPYFKRIDHWEQMDILSSISQLGGKVTRPYVFSIPKDPTDLEKHIIVESGYGTEKVKWNINEDLFTDIDSALSLANQFNVKIIIPFIDDWEWWGGVETFSKMYGGNRRDFYENKVIIEGWKLFIKKVINRQNTISGLHYRNDPAILAWETGNELQLDQKPVPSSWTLDIASYIKSQDVNHLVMDGSYGIHGWPIEILTASDIDIFSNHYYLQPLGWTPYTVIGWISIVVLIISCLVTIFLAMKNRIFSMDVIHQRIPDTDELELNSIDDRPHVFSRYPTLNKRKYYYAANMTVSLLFLSLILAQPIPFPTLDRRIQKDTEYIHGFNKAFIIGEIGLVSNQDMKKAVTSFLNVNASGFLVWSLRMHTRQGGFYTHEEHDGYWSYHYPGFPETDGFPKDERLMIELILETNANLGNQRNLTIPTAPLLFSPLVDESFTHFRWRGTPGASSYSLIMTYPFEKIIKEGIVDNTQEKQTILKLPLDEFRKLDSSNFTMSVIAYGDWTNVTSNSVTFDLNINSSM